MAEEEEELITRWRYGGGLASTLRKVALFFARIRTAVNPLSPPFAPNLAKTQFALRDPIRFFPDEVCSLDFMRPCACSSFVMRYSSIKTRRCSHLSGNESHHVRDNPSTLRAQAQLLPAQADFAVAIFSEMVQSIHAGQRGLREGCLALKWKQNYISAEGNCHGCVRTSSLWSNILSNKMIVC